MGGWVVGGWWCLNVNLVIGFGPNLDLALWPRAKPINFDTLRAAMKTNDESYESEFSGIDTRLIELEDQVDTLKKDENTNANIKHLQASLIGAKSDIESLDKKVKNLSIKSLITDLGKLKTELIMHMKA